MFKFQVDSHIIFGVIVHIDTETDGQGSIVAVDNKSTTKETRLKAVTSHKLSISRKSSMHMIKGTHTIYLLFSFHEVNKKSIIPWSLFPS